MRKAAPRSGLPCHALDASSYRTVSTPSFYSQSQPGNETELKESHSVRWEGHVTPAGRQLAIPFSAITLLIPLPRAQIQNQPDDGQWSERLALAHLGGAEIESLPACTAEWISQLGRCCAWLGPPLTASWITIPVISTWREKLCSPSTTPSGQKCYLCLRNDLLPMCPDRTSREMERETGIEPATNSLEGCDSTTELLPPGLHLLF
jgi:hypothetical protein